MIVNQALIYMIIVKKIKAFPNPTNGNITISVDNFNGNIQTEVFDIMGNRLQISNETNISLRLC